MTADKNGSTGPPVEFNPSAEFGVSEGPRDIGMCFVGDGFVAGYGDPKALGWVSRVVGRTKAQGADLSAYNLGVRGDSSAEVMQRWRAECGPRWSGRAERRLIVSVGARDVPTGVSTARSRLNLANVLDEAATSGIATFVVGPAPTLDAELNARLKTLSAAQADVAQRRGVPFVDCYRPLVEHDQWLSDLSAGDGTHPGQAGYGLMAWLVLHYGWHRWLQLQD